MPKILGKKNSLLALNKLNDGLFMHCYFNLDINEIMLHQDKISNFFDNIKNRLL